MSKTKAIRLVCLLVITAAFTAGLFRLFVLRFEAGDIYPPYSTLRSDPLGTRALYESLQDLDSVSVRRNFEPLHRARFDPQTTLFYLGTPTLEADKKIIDLFERFMAEGGRVVIGMTPIARADANDESPDTCRPGRVNSREQRRGAKTRGDRDCTERSKKRPAQDPAVSAETSCQAQDWTAATWLRERWGIAVAFMEGAQAGSEGLSAWTEDTALPSRLSWHSQRYFDSHDTAWRTLYRCRQYPVIVERSFGKGNLLLMADTYLFSNEALRVERYPDLLSRLIGPNARLVFDESHLGILRQPGLAGLIRQHQFHWVVGALTVLAVLFVWKNTVYFVPPNETDRRDHHAADAEKDHTEALVSLVRRNIASRDLLRVCVAEWRKTDGGHRDLSGFQSQRIQQLVRDTAVDPITGYQQICRLLSEGNDHE